MRYIYTIMPCKGTKKNYKPLQFVTKVTIFNILKRIGIC